MGIANFIEKVKRWNHELDCYERFVKLQNEKIKGNEVNETDEDVRYRAYLTDLLSIDKPKKNPIGFC